MLTFYHKLAKTLHRLRWLLWVILMGSVIGFGVLLLSSSSKQNETLLTLSLLTGVWSLCALAIQMTFVGTIPVVEPDDGIFRRLKKRFSIAIRWTLAIGVTGVSAAVLITSFRVLNALN